MNLKSAKILVTGASGFIGSRLCEKLVLECQSDVTAMVRNMGRAARVGRLPVRLAKGSILDKRLVRKLVSEADIVIHLTAGSDEAIVNGTGIIAKAARETGVQRFVHMSSAAVYGLRAGPEHLCDDIPRQLTGTGYSDAKIKAERVLQREVDKGLSAVALRPRVVWGPYSTWVTDFYSAVAAQACPLFYLIDDGAGACNTVFIDNLIEGVYRAIEHSERVGKYYYITDDEVLSWRQYYEKFGGYLPQIEFRSITSESLFSHFARPKRIAIRSPIALDSVKRILGSSGFPLYRHIQNLSEHQKFKIMDALGMDWEERHIQPRSKQVPNLIDERRLHREVGRTHTQIDTIKRELNYKPRFSFDEAAEITRGWLTFAGLV